MEQKDICRASHTYCFDYANNIDLLARATYVAKHLMNLVHHIVDKYYIGGSVAGELLGCHFNRKLHDIDIIIPKGYFLLVYQYFIKCPLFDCNIVTDYGNNTVKNIMIHVDDITIDIIESEYDKDDIRFRYHIADIKTLVDNKLKYNRPKDNDDMPELLRVYKNIVGEDYPINDVVF